jgi:hypothetical protein
MNTILERFIRKEPHFPTMYEESVMKRLSLKGAYDQGGVRSEEETFSVGKFFNRYYECFMFAAIVGIKAGYECLLIVHRKERNFCRYRIGSQNGWQITYL